MLCRFLVSSMFPNFRGSPSGLTLPSIGSGEIETIPRTVTPTGLLPLDCRNKSFSGLKQNFSFHWNEVTNLQHPILFLFFSTVGGDQMNPQENRRWEPQGTCGNPWSGWEWGFFPRCHVRRSWRLMPVAFGSPSQWRAKAPSSSCQELRKSTTGLEAAQLLPTAYMGAVWKGNLFPISQCPHAPGSVITHPPTLLHSRH